MRSMNIFNSVKLPGVKSSKFDLSHDVKLSFSMGELVPTMCMETLPGDIFEIDINNFLRFMPLVTPVMHKVNVRTDVFFVPNRILFAEWDKFITGDDTVEAPYIPLGPSDYSTVSVGSLADYLGIPPGEYSNPQLRISAFPFAAYLKIWNEYYRDQNLQAEDERCILTPGESLHDWSGEMDAGILRRAWMHDYFTSALPFAQKGDAVQIPLTTGVVPVTLDEDATVSASARDSISGVNLTGDITASGGQVQTGGTPTVFDPNGSLVVDVQSDAVDINTLRRAFRLQEFYERIARGGSRLTEFIRSMFDVKSSDARLQRPELLGSSFQKMVISEVLATAQSETESVAIGQMGGHGISFGGGKKIRYRCEEHGFIIAIVNVQPVTAYSQGLHRSWSRFTYLDYAWPTFANIGEQEILNQEVQVFHSVSRAGTFGYIPRYAEYKYMNSRIAGEMRTTLEAWHLGRDLPTNVALNSDFIQCVPRTDIFAVTDPEEDHIVAHVVNSVDVIRKLPYFGVPTI